MNNRSYPGIIGSILVIAGALSPMLRLPIVGNWNYLDIDISLASIVFILAGLGLIASVINKPKLLRFSGWALLVVIIFTFIAVYFKVNNYFSFIPFKKLASAAAGLIKYNWIGWILLLVGSALMIVGGRQKEKTSVVLKD